MTRNEAIQAMEEGNKVTHRYFSAHEWISSYKDRKDSFLSEEGYIVNREIFWQDRPSVAWENDWEIWQDPAATSIQDKEDFGISENWQLKYPPANILEGEDCFKVMDGIFTIATIPVSIGLEESEKVAKLITSAPALKRENEQLRVIVKSVELWFGNEANYPEGTAGYKIAQKAKALLTTKK